MIKDDYLKPTENTQSSLVYKGPWPYYIVSNENNSKPNTFFFFSQPALDRIGRYDIKRKSTAFLSLPPSRDKDSYKSITIVKSADMSEHYYLIIGSIFNAKGIGLYFYSIDKLMDENYQPQERGRLNEDVKLIKLLRNPNIISPVQMKPSKIKHDEFFLIDEETNYFMKINSQGHILKKIDLPYNAPTVFQLDKNEKKVFFRFAYSNHILHLDFEKSRIIKDMAVPLGFFSFLGGGGLLKDNSKLIISSLPNNSVHYIDQTDFRLIKSIEHPEGPKLIKKIRGRNLYAVLGYYSGIISIYSSYDDQLLYRTGLAKGLHDIWVAPDGSLYISSKKGIHYLPKDLFLKDQK
jgi:hypothetical protein